MSETAETVLTEIRAELRGMRADQRQDGALLRTEIQAVRSELRGEIAELRGVVREDFRLLLARQDRHLYWLLAAFVALLGVMAHGFRWL